MKNVIVYIIVIFAIGVLVFLVGYNTGRNRNSVQTINTIDTVFVDTTKYNNVESNIKTVRKSIDNIKKDRDEKLKGIDTITNDSAVSLFYRLLSK